MAYLHTWVEPEWFTPNDGIYEKAVGSSDDAFLVEAEVTYNGEDGWFWLVKATSNLSEWPEIQDAGQVATMDDGKAAAEACVAHIYEQRKGKCIRGHEFADCALCAGPYCTNGVCSHD